MLALHCIHPRNHMHWIGMNTTLPASPCKMKVRKQSQPTLLCKPRPLMHFPHTHWGLVMPMIKPCGWGEMCQRAWFSEKRRLRPFPYLHLVQKKLFKWTLNVELGFNMYFNKILLSNNSLL